MSDEQKEMLRELYLSLMEKYGSRDVHDEHELFHKEIVDFAKKDNAEDELKKFYDKFLWQSNATSSLGSALSNIQLNKRPSPERLHEIFKDLLALAKEDNGETLMLNDATDRKLLTIRTNFFSALPAKADLVFNRAVASVLYGWVSCFPNNESFFEVYEWLIDGKYIDGPSPKGKEKDWYVCNRKLMNSIREALANVEGADRYNMSRFPWMIGEYIKLGESSKGGVQMCSLKEYVSLLMGNKNLILHGAPGTGKTYLAKEIAKEIGCSGDRIGFVQFHPSYDYTDFIEGLRPTKPDEKGNIGFERKNGVFKAFCEKALNDKDKKYVFIIDEINRGEMSKIFGELFFSIDPGYRGKDGCIKTQYANMLAKANAFDEALQALPDNDECKKSQEDLGWFFVPENVYIIGTMNDIDRSVESMDFAMRRRFAFKEVEAAERVEMLEQEEELEPVCDELKKRMTKLNDQIDHTDGLSSAYHIGAAYFKKYKLYANEKNPFESLWKNHLEGLLKEYLRGVDDGGSKLDRLMNAYGIEKKSQETENMTSSPSVS